jgi:hypothetical protein
MYSLLNYIAATSKETTESSSSNQLLSNPLYTSSATFPNDNITFQQEACDGKKQNTNTQIPQRGGGGAPRDKNFLIQFNFYKMGTDTIEQ